MRTLLFSAALALTTATVAHAGDLQPGHAHSLALNGVNGIAYYTVETGGYRVVAVLAASETAKPVRFTAVLLPGQSVAVSVPGNDGEPENAVEFVRQGDDVLVAPEFVALN